jgi:hypothetical protein
MKRIVAVVGLDDRKYFCIDRVINAIKNQIKMPDVLLELVLFYNGENEALIEYLKKFGEVIWHKKNLKGDMHTIVDMRNLMFEYARKEKPDFLFMVDADVVVNKYTLQNLMNHKNEVVSALYYSFVNGRKFPLAFMLENGEWKWIDERFLVGVMKVNACGLGCCLINPKIFMSFNFRTNEQDKNEDLCFGEDLVKEGMFITLDCSEIVRHIK